MIRLSDHQVHVLAEVSNVADVPVFFALVVGGRSWRRTFDRLVDAGLVSFHPYAYREKRGGPQGAYKITREGRQAVKRFVETGRMVYESDMETARGCVADRG